MLHAAHRITACLITGLVITTAPAAFGQAQGRGGPPDRGQLQASIVFQILASELALAQGQIGVAAATYLNLARQTQDPVAARRATELSIDARAPQRAEEAAAIWLRNAPQDKEAQGTLDLLQIATGENEKLVRSLLARRRTLAAEPDGARKIEELYDYVAGLVGRAPEKADGLRIFERVTEADRDKSGVIYTRAMLHERAGQYQDMEQILRSLIARDPAHAHAHNALGYHLADRNERLSEALKLIERALALAPEDAHIIDSMGWVQFRLGRLDLAEKYLRMAHQRQPDAEISAHLAEVLWVSGRGDEAEALLRSAFLSDPRNEVLQGTLKRLGIPASRIHPR
jgi:tetratricopeptide (TPR) repeat protein